MPVEILGEVSQPLDLLVRKVLHEILDSRPQEIVVHVSRPHTDLVVHIRKPFDRKLKFNSPLETEVARELQASLRELADEELGPAR